MFHRKTAIHRMIYNTSSKELSAANTHAVVSILEKEISSTDKENSKINYKR